MEKLKRVACYIRVSTEEQKKKGYSVDTQRDNLNEYLGKQNDMVLVDFYIDDGVSADKLKKRTGLQRLLEDVKANKIDMIIFTKLDRWFRSVQKYYQIQSVLEENDVVWRAIHEDYETITSGGKFKVNIMLSVAQQERDRCSERIRDVFEYRSKQGYAITHILPVGLKIEDHHVVPDEETKHIVQAIFNYFEACNSVRKTLLYINETYDLRIHYNPIRKILGHRLYIGEYRGNKNYCEPIISVEQFERVQAKLKMNTKKRKNNRTYIFSALCVCSHCHNKMVGNTPAGANRWGEEYRYYRCNKNQNAALCDNNMCIAEKYIENILLETIEEEAKKHIVAVEISESQKTKPRSNQKTIEKKMQRLNDLYVNGFIDMDKYRADYTSLQNQIIPETTQEPKDLSVLKKFLESDFKEIYPTLSVEKKQALWRSIIKEIRVSGKEIVDIVFL